MRLRGIAAATLAAAVLLAIAAGCGGDDGDEENVLTPGVLRIGYVWDGSGELAPRDAEIGNAAEIAVQQINAVGGVDGVLTLALERRRAADAAGAGSTAARLRARGVNVFILPCSRRAQRAIVRRLSGPLLLATCGEARLAKRVGGYWPVGMTDRTEAAALAEFVEEQGFENVILARGVEVSFVADADAVFTGHGAAEAAALVRELRHRTPETALLGTHLLDSSSFRRQAGAAAEGVIFTTFGFPEPGSALDEFYERYRARNGGRRPEGSATALGYEAVKVLEVAINVFESTRPARLREALALGMEVGGPLGRVVYTGRGRREPRVSVALVTVRDGRLELVTKKTPEVGS